MNNKTARTYKALMTDVDGTLLTNGGEIISARVKQSIQQSKEKIHIGIVSGRPLHRVTLLFDELQLEHPCIITGGAQIVDPVSRKILWEQPLLHEDVQLITPILNKLNKKTWVVDGTEEVLYAKDLKLQKPMSFFISKIKEEEADEVIKQLSNIPTLALTKVVAYVDDCISLHITHANATKQYATIKVAELLNVKSEEIIGVGDGYNDYPLFKACGLKVAVGNAVDGLKEKADYIAPSVDDDAIAHILEKFIN